MKIILAAALSLGLLSGCVGSDFNAHRADFNRFDYIGPQTPDAVCAYVEETADAIDWVMTNVEGIEHFYYMPRTGRIALRMNWPAKLGNHAKAAIFNQFLDRRLHLNTIVELRSLGDRVHTTIRATGGRDRVRDLSGIETQPEDCSLDAVNFRL